MFICYESIEIYFTVIGCVLQEIGSSTCWKSTRNGVCKSQFWYHLICWSKYNFRFKYPSNRCECWTLTLGKIWRSLDFNWGRFNVVHRLTVVRSTITVKYAYSTTTVKTMKFQKYRTVFKQRFEMFIIENIAGFANLFVFLC